MNWISPVTPFGVPRVKVRALQPLPGGDTGLDSAKTPGSTSEQVPVPAAQDGVMKMPMTLMKLSPVKPSEAFVRVRLVLNMSPTFTGVGKSGTVEAPTPAMAGDA